MIFEITPQENQRPWHHGETWEWCGEFVIEEVLVNRNFLTPDNYDLSLPSGT